MTSGLGDATPIDVDRGVPFAAPGGATLRLDLYRPGRPRGSPAGTDPAAARRAAVVLVPGRDWRSPDRGQWARYALDLAERGYVCAVPAYRGSDAATFPAQVRDLKAAVKWLRARGGDIGIDPARIGAFGHGAGAHLAVLAALSAGGDELAPRATAFAESTREGAAAASDALAAVVGVAGTYALEHQPETDALVALLGGDREAEPEAWKRASPSTYLGADGADSPPPVLLLHGEDDDVVPPMGSELFYDLLEARDAPADCVVAADAGHDVHETQRAFVLEWTAGFLDRHLR
ncbi:prolyl oligopeptidase family serine peptidase [Halobellus rubicundus]|uniref:Prolyl oligopeptidase family serine peptidase n=1 Tax=Halobellus rubicundus TaxID=2996466 RepID=A0ABD5M8E8_9EURY